MCLGIPLAPRSCHLFSLKEDLVDEVYATYILIMENLLEEHGGTSPRTEALCFLSLVEGSIIFIGSDRRWEND